jgi:hypothetical protein
MVRSVFDRAAEPLTGPLEAGSRGNDTPAWLNNACTVAFGEPESERA